MIVAITGGTGFIGKHLIARHVARGDQVRYLTRSKAPQDVHGAIAHIGNLNSSIEELRKFVSGADVLYHCAAELRNEAEMHNTNVVGTANLLAAANGEMGRWVQLDNQRHGSPTLPRPPIGQTWKTQYRNINLLAIAYACRPRLRSRLTLSRLALLRNPWAFGGGVSHSSFVTHASILTSHASTAGLRRRFTGMGTLPYHST